MKKNLMAALCALLVCVLTMTGASAEGSVAGESDMTDVIDIVPEGMTPVTADMLNDGTWFVNVDVSSSMFKVNGAEVTVEGGALTARLLMNSEAYTYMYPGEAEDAAAADESAWIALETDGEDVHSFTMPVEGLNQGVVCAAFSARKQLWYPRTILLRADSLPLEAWKAECLTTAASLGLADGAYVCHVSLTGSGRATLQEEAGLKVEGGECTCYIAFDTKKIDYVIVGGEKYEPTSTDGGAAFTLPLPCFDLPVTIVVDSTAIKPAVEVTYTMTFDSASIKPV